MQGAFGRVVRKAYVNIAFANELLLISDDLNIDVWELIKLANKHSRVNILQPGPGVGGYCIAVDPQFIVDAAAETSQLIHTAPDVNDSKPAFVVDKVKRAVECFKNPAVSCLDLAFKADIDDLRLILREHWQQSWNARLLRLSQTSALCRTR